jgi:CheY-like chemotaxis protein
LAPVYKKILLGDDDPDDRELFQEVLARVSPLVELQVAENGLQLLELLQEQELNKPDLIFLDINMPVMNGLECLRKLKSISEYKNIPAIVYSTSSATRDIQMAYDWGAFLYITKPDDFKTLEKIIEIIIMTPGELMVNLLDGYEQVK